MTRDEKLQLLSERTELRRMLERIPADDVIDRLGVESRLEELDEELAQHGELGPEPARARLTFRGRPVIGSYGVFAEFGVSAMGTFVEAVTAVAASTGRPLKATGPIPNRDQHQLLITHTVPGSFGFEVEEYRDDLPLDDEPSAMAAALEKTQALMFGTQGSDDDLADVLSDTDVRALNALRAFLKVITDADAVCALQFRDRIMRFDDTGDVRRSLERLGDQNVREEERELEGQFLGVLPEHRTFEFRCADGRVITGKVGQAVEDADQINGLLHQNVRARFTETRVGIGRPRYALIALPQAV